MKQILENAFGKHFTMKKTEHKESKFTSKSEKPHN